ncbi:MAG: aminotransferase class I/II-fold pyridoxal phosphate-dependent enzyme [Candidatus Bathyarchaeota archaeon]|nr:aminotransferase class I/II-fold pyridoxal phosphate-dependent enzyme [Candidatus Bathyarchaeota archaeon]
MPSVKVTRRVQSIEYAIRDVIPYADELVAQGKDIYYLNVGDPPAFDLDTPQHIKDALRNALEKGNNSYSPSEGLPELREAIARKEKRVNQISLNAQDILVTEGVSEGIQMLLAALIEKGDEILFPAPTYPPYVSYTRFFDGTPVPYKTVEENGWQPDLDDLRNKITSKTRALVITNPNNPTGALYSRKLVKEMVDIAAEHDLLIISDEIYDQITFSDDFASAAHLAKDLPVVGLNGFSKTYQMTGWRLGYMYFKAPNGELDELKDAVEKECRIRLSANTPVQKAGVAALDGSQDHIKQVVQTLRERRDYAWKRLNEIDGVSCAKPEGAFYIFPKIHGVGSTWKTDLDFVVDLLKQTGVLIVNGSGFDPVYGAGHARAVFLPPIETLEQALNAMEDFIKSKQ